ncbi:toll/interleukin-1 receptor domain-containing protein [Oscillatoria sp. CS-180]|uniref:toll/interleukin-1 receptor domain-containing protein n=1 Tax=Oscillatoria sp. CS-180 TaxID=3021720 RepID=UPI00232DABD1|nr:toll/interleukin-1 receptor domain-containing protein [Oscillatoria sp. CS-180]MDB9527069.1 toll/interleukin-1 receptor domain-containing protein [Oscillatoria sp. CS-180]
MACRFVLTELATAISDRASSFALFLSLPMTEIVLDPKTRLALIRSLASLPPSQFEELLFALDLPQGILSSSQASQGTRAKELLDWAKGPTGTGLSSVLQILDDYVPLANLGIAVAGKAVASQAGSVSQRASSNRESGVTNPVSASAKAVFISYAWGGESEAITNQIDAVFQTKAITLIRDKRDLGFKGRIKAFMEDIGQGRAVIVVISDKYLRSENCMFELVEIAANGDFYDRIFPIVLADAQIYKPLKRIQYVQHWEKEIAELDEAMKTVSAANLQGFREAIDLYTRIRNTIATLTETLKDMNTLTPEMHVDSEFADLFAAIEQRLNRD